MSMDRHRRLLLYAVLTAYLWIGALSTVSVTVEAAYLIPACAQECFQSFVSKNFPLSTCDPSDLSCFCASDSVSGYTIAEGALICLVSGCPIRDSTTPAIVYSMCSGVPNAEPNTHPVLVATAAPATTSGQTPTVLSTPARSSSPTSSTVPQSSQRVLGSSDPFTIISKSSTTQTPKFLAFPSTTLSTSSAASSKSSSAESSTTSSKVSSIISSAGSSTTSATSYSTVSSVVSSTTSSSILTSSSSTLDAASSSTMVAAAASSTASAAPAPVLTKPQIAGVVVASVGAAALGLGLCFLLLFWRRRKAQRRYSGSSFGGDKALPSADSTPDMGVIAPRDFGYHQEGTQAAAAAAASSRGALGLATTSSNENRSNQHLAPLQPVASRTPVPRGPRPRAEGVSPITPGSLRTHSQLLPDKPTSPYTLFPPPLPPSPHSRRKSQDVEAVGAARNHVTNNSTPTRSKSKPRFPGTLDTSQAHMQQSRNSVSPSSPPQTYPTFQSTQPRPQYQPFRPGHSSEASEPLVPIIRKPMPSHRAPPARDVGSPPSARTLQPSLPRTYPPPPPVDVHYLEAIANDQRRANRPRRKKSDPRPITYLSEATHTSIEDGHDDEDMPEPVSAFTESHSPIHPSPFKYPPIPYSAAESPSSRVYTAGPPAPQQQQSFTTPPPRARDVMAATAAATAEDTPDSPRREARKSAKRQIFEHPGLQTLQDPNWHSRSPQTPTHNMEAPWHDRLSPRKAS